MLLTEIKYKEIVSSTSAQMTVQLKIKIYQFFIQKYKKF